MKTLNPKIKAVLDRIQASVPKYLTDKVVIKEKLAPEVVEVLKKGVVDEEFAPEVRKKWQMVLDSGYLEKEIDKEDPYIAQEIEAYIELEMAKAVVRKEIPKLKKMEKYEVLFRKYNDIKKYNDKKYQRN
jgi:hypothetical protein